MSLYDDSLKKKKEFKTLGNTYDMFPIGTHVLIVTLCQDFNFFYDETGTVVDNKGVINFLERLEGIEEDKRNRPYLGITVEFDKPRHFDDGSVQTGFSFNPDDLLMVDKNLIDFVNKFD